MKRMAGLIISLIFLSALPVASAGLDSAFGSTSPLNTTAVKAGFKTDTSVISIASSVISVILTLLGVIFIILIIYSGYIWMTAGGSEEKVNRASGIIKQSIIGLIIIMGAYGISYFFLNLFFK